MKIAKLGICTFPRALASVQATPFGTTRAPMVAPSHETLVRSDAPLHRPLSSTTTITTGNVRLVSRTEGLGWQ